MKINTFKDSINISNITDEYPLHTRFGVNEELHGYILAAHADPYPTFIIELKKNCGYESTWRRIITLPSKNTKAWLDDFIRKLEEEEIEITGIISLEDVLLVPYEIPEDYRKYIIRDGDVPNWYE